MRRRKRLYAQLRVLKYEFKSTPNSPERLLEIEAVKKMWHGKIHRKRAGKWHVMCSQKEMIAVKSKMG